MNFLESSILACWGRWEGQTPLFLSRSSEISCLSVSGQDVRCESQPLQPTRQGAYEEGNGEDEKWLFVEPPWLGFWFPLQSGGEKPAQESGG